MEYRINLDERARQEIAQAIQYYLTFRKRGPAHFISDLENAIDQLKANPYKAPRYKNARAIRLPEFPFALYFTVNESNKTATIHACFQDFRNPRRTQTGSQVQLGQIETNKLKKAGGRVSPFALPQPGPQKERRGSRRPQKAG